MSGIPRVKIFGFIAGIIAFMVVLHMPIAAIRPQAQGLLALLALSVAFWVTSPVPMYLTALLGCSLLPWIMKLAPQEVAFSGFAGSVFWFLFGSLGIAGSLAASGITKRVAFLIMSRLKPKYGRLMLLTFMVMFVLAFIIPAGTARTALVLTLVAPIIPALGVPVRSNIGKTVLMSVPILAWAGAVMVVTGGIIPVIAWGTLNKLGYYVSWIQWAMIMIVPTLAVFAIMFLTMPKLFKPEVNEIRGGMEKFKEDLKELGPVTSTEKKAFAIIILILAFWITEPLHHVSVQVVTLVGLLLFVLPGIGTRSFEDLIKTMPWEPLIFVGSIMSLATIAETTGLDDFISKTFLEPILNLGTSPVSLVIASWILNTVAGLTLLLAPTMALFVPSIAAHATAIGFSPVIATIIYQSMVPMFFLYVVAPSPFLALPYGAFDQKDWMKIGIVYWLACPAVHIVMLFTWYTLFYV